MRKEKKSQHLKLEEERNMYLLTTFAFYVSALGIYTYFKKKTHT